jgi:hypothetical protein
MGTPPTDPYNSRRPPGDDVPAQARSPWPVVGAAAAALVVGIVGGALIGSADSGTKTVTHARTTVTAAGGGSTSKAEVTVVAPTTPARTATVVETTTATVTVTVTTPTVTAP